MPAPSNQIDPVSRVYAQALLEMAAEAGQLDEVGEEMAQLSDLLEHSADLQRLIANPVIGRSQRTEMVGRLFKSQLTDLLYRFVQVVNHKGRLAALPGIASAFALLLAEHRGEVTVEAQVAQRMDDATARRVASSLSASLGKKITLQQSVDKSLLGGLRLRIGDQLIDASVLRQLQRMETQLKDAGRERARELTAAGDVIA